MVGYRQKIPIVSWVGEWIDGVTSALSCTLAAGFNTVQQQIKGKCKYLRLRLNLHRNNRKSGSIHHWLFSPCRSISIRNVSGSEGTCEKFEKRQWNTNEKSQPVTAKTTPQFMYYMAMWTFT
jgi:hypothetical protein